MYYRLPGKLISLFAFFILSVSCGSPAHTPESRNGNSSERPLQASSPNKLSRQESQALCERIAEIKELPFDPEERGIDSVYDAFMDAGESVVPCLITKVSDTTSMRDPRSAPRYPDIDNKIGDVAYFILLDITKLDIVEFLPPNVKASFEVDGVYAYFKYVKTRENRLKLQDRLFEWYRDTYGSDARTL